MASGERNLTQKEIWDDSTLVESWDQALQEYKKYHSIQATGGNMDEAIKQLEAQQAAESAQVNDSSRYTTAVLTGYSGGSGNGGQPETAKTSNADAMDLDEGKGEASISGEASLGTLGDKDSTSEGDLKAPEQEQVTNEETTAAAENTHAEADKVSPEAVQIGIGQVQDPELKNLLMAWYWAGYYTGLHEGQQKAKSS